MKLKSPSVEGIESKVSNVGQKAVKYFNVQFILN